MTKTHSILINHEPRGRARTGFLAGLLILGTAFGLAARQAGVPRPARPQTGGTLRVKPFPNDLSLRLDPIVTGPSFLYEQLYDGLVRLDNNLNVVPALAEYWVISEDGRRYTFQLRQGVRFHNGAELTAEDVKFSLERLLTPRADAGFRTYIQSRVVGAEAFFQGRAADVAGFVVRDKATFEIHWTNSYVSGLHLLCMTFCKILPRDAVRAEGEGFFLKPAGTGPFRFGYWLRDPKLNVVGVRLERYRDYYGRTAYPDALEYSPHFTEDQFRDRDVHIIPSESERLARPPYQVVEDDPFDISFIAFSCRIPPLDDPFVRRALSLAVDKARLAEAATSSFHMPLVTHNIIPVKIPGFFPLDDREGCDPGRAKALLEEAGIVMARDLPELTVIEIENPRTSRPRVYRELKAQLEALGIQVERRAVADGTSVQLLEKPYLILFDWDMVFPDPETVIQPLFESQAVVNQWLMGYINPTVDRLLEKAIVEPSWARRSSLFREIERILLEDRPVLPLYSIRRRLSVQPEVRGVKLPPLGFSFLNAKDIWFER
ncbi:MAG: ABC transporter substrate-binding protein [Candidatus Aminicenantes bacterium]|nr:ABC transporter substrate-binding protein [Candidatus Aminicenantes bacterium]